MNQVIIGGFTFTDNDILSGSIHLENAMVSETLASDTFNVTLQASGGTGQLQDVFGTLLFSSEGDALFASNSVDVDSVIGALAYGDEVEFYHDSVLYAKFYLKSVTRTAKTMYQIECVSIIGLLANLQFDGGVYGIDNADTIGDLVSDIMGAMPYTIDNDVASILIYGWLPALSCRDALQQVLFACGASVIKTVSGGINITFNVPYDATVIANDDLYMGGKKNLTAPATSVSLTEHTFYKSAATSEVLLFDNSNGIAVTSAKQTFQFPYYSYRADGLTIDSSHPNYAVVSGTGKLYGVPYEHQTRELTQTLSVAVNPKEVTVTQATLISSANSAQTLKRLASYYANAQEISYGLVVDDEHSGDLLSFTDPFEEASVGYIKSMDIALSRILKSDTKIISSWRPNHVGNSYDAYILIDENVVESGTWTPYPWLVGVEGLLTIFNGSQGGEGGYDGEDGEDAGNGTATNYYVVGEGSRFIMSAGLAGHGGEGGRSGHGGEGARKYNITPLTLAASHSVTLGDAGTGGAKETEGADGGITTFDSYDSDNLELSGEYVNIVDGSIYCSHGDEGTKGGDGGDGGEASASNPNVPIEYESGSNGQDVNTHVGGEGTEGSTNAWSHPNIGTINMNVGGGGGGGASVSGDGSDGGAADQSITWNTHPDIQALYASKKGGDGGDGADATTIPSSTKLGKGGHGGHGGGGGGGGGASAAGGLAYTVNPASGGQGGSGAGGGAGSKGFGVFYFSAEDNNLLKASIKDTGFVSSNYGVKIEVSSTALAIAQPAENPQANYIPNGATLDITLRTGRSGFNPKRGGVYVNGTVVYQGTGSPSDGKFPLSTYQYTANGNISIEIQNILSQENAVCTNVYITEE